MFWKAELVSYKIRLITIQSKSVWRKFQFFVHVWKHCKIVELSLIGFDVHKKFIAYVTFIVSICLEFFRISYKKINTASTLIDLFRMIKFIDEALCRKMQWETCLNSVLLTIVFIIKIGSDFCDNS